MSSTAPEDTTKGMCLKNMLLIEFSFGSKLAEGLKDELNWVLIGEPLEFDIKRLVDAVIGLNVLSDMKESLRIEKLVSNIFNLFI